MSSGLTRRLLELEDEYAREQAILFPVRMYWIDEETGDTVGTEEGSNEETDWDSPAGSG
jgi:hypothetical protein